MKGMREIIYSMPDQITEAISIFNCFWPKYSNKVILHRHIHRVLICGMGGSGISGDIVSALYPEIDVVVNKDYEIHKYVDKDTLGILVSYSGNTEETLNNYDILQKRKIPVVLISSNGRLLKNSAILKIQIPSGLPPRGALGYLFTPIPLLLYRTGLLKKNPEMQLANLVLFLKKWAKSIEKKGKSLAKSIVNRLPVIYANSNLYNVVAKRWQCQLNENSKIFCHTNIIPEMNHNEIVGLGRPKRFNRNLIAIFVDDPNAHPRNRMRLRIIKEIIRKEVKDLKSVDINPAGRTILEQVFWAIMLGDFLSLHIALKTGIDPVSVKRIDYLKHRLSGSK